MHRYLLRIPSWLFAEVERRAARQGISARDYIQQAIEATGIERPEGELQTDGAANDENQDTD